MTVQEAHIRIFSSGYCTGNNWHIHRGEHPMKLTFYARWALIEHQQTGRILFDTGYSRRFFKATRRFPEVLYQWITPVTINSEEECVNKLKDLHIDNMDINHIVISHFHADHIGGLKDFGTSKFWCRQDALALIRNSGRLNTLTKGLLKTLVPDDIDQRISFPEYEFPEETKDGLTCWKWNNNIWFVDLPGHARGHMGLLVKGSNLGDILLVGDATWSAHAYRDKVYPPRMVSIIADGYKNLTNTIDLIHDYQLANPDTLIIPSHCEESYRKILSN